MDYTAEELSAIEKLETYIRKNKMRYTKERERLLAVIYSVDKRLSVDEIMQEHKKLFPKMPICRSTIYNTIDLFLDALLINEQKDKNVTVYSKIKEESDEIELVCKYCRKTRVIQMKNCHNFLKRINIADFQVTNHRLILHGICAPCKYAELKEKLK